jgi:rRNA maturation RNase YbeY
MWFGTRWSSALSRPTKSIAAGNGMSELYVRNRQRARPINARLLESIAADVILKTCPSDSHIGILLVSSREMTRLNEAFLKHAGPTDVIAFGYSSSQSCSFHGEVFICVAEAVKQARRFGTIWQKELVRYLVHGLLHFQGYDDGTSTQRRRMKRVENGLVRKLAREFSLRQLQRAPRMES